MESDNQTSSGGGTANPPLFSFSKFLPWIGWLLLIAVLALGGPSYKRLIKKNEDLSTEKQRLSNSLEAATKTKTSTRTFFPDGRVASETHSETDSTSSTKSSSVLDTSVSSKSTEDLTAIKGRVVVGLGYNVTRQSYAGLVQTNIINPFGGAVVLEPPTSGFIPTVTVFATVSF